MSNIEERIKRLEESIKDKKRKSEIIYGNTEEEIKTKKEELRKKYGDNYDLDLTVIMYKKVVSGGGQ